MDVWGLALLTGGLGRTTFQNLGLCLISYSRLLTTLMPSRSGSTLPSRLSSQLTYTIHGIPKFFLLRRLEAGVFGKSLPQKNELVIYCPLSVEQRGLYDAIVKGSLRHLLLSLGGGENVKREEDASLCQRAPGVES